ncbi:iron-sulfur cluster assembly scaffold protein [Candidatus Falkowbacteria bacterium HGW-Falkowbacteria-1]|jgi:nitrogen fixation NifU-like protein|uniref:Iron-sulfur cluster assembly scaffold protein n=1 Tax=Candidatus Falkowbacteria bacterium HGW-Falkowbacteria-1 TaxID=2013768 RepID=A0A2N2E9L8_9BACT|nr:MAG: iron-sulfur cluster assembly scaffold protein [Candidatus Falkowbacteria bacterium HGW-Falkowbacteria-1]
MSLNYSKKTLDNFRNPKNIGEIKNPDATAEVGNMVCGDKLFFSLKVKDEKIKDIKFLSFGCASNIATASVMTEMVKGEKLKDAKNFDWNRIVEELEGLPRQKVHCSVLAVEGLRKVISEYEKKNKTKQKNSELPKIRKNKKIK